MKFEKSIGELKGILQQLGFKDGLEQQLRSQICFQPERFLLGAISVKEKDTIEILLQFEKVAGNDYRCRLYDALLRKNILVEDAAQLDHQMNGIAWADAVAGKLDPVTEEAIDSIITQLYDLEAKVDTNGLATLLKFKYWRSTALEERIENISFYKGQYEIVQRFYFFEGAAQINIEEAYRFLNNKWMEKQFQLKKKQTEPVEESASAGTNELVKKVKMFPKNKRGKKKL